MVRYLQYIVIVFSLIGLLAGSFFFLQNKNDIFVSWSARGKLDYDFLKENCPLKLKDYVYPCIKNAYQQFLPKVSLTGTSMGLKMVFTALDDDKDNTTKFENNKIKQFHYSINYLEINNLALDNAYRRYFGFDNLYGGFVSSLDRYYEQGFEFNQNIIIGLEGIDGISKVKNKLEHQELIQRLSAAKTEFYKIKDEVQLFIESELARLTQLQ